MNLLLVCSSIGGGGAERVAVNLANSLTKSGHKVSFFFRRKVSNSYKLGKEIEIFNPGREDFFSSFLFLKKVIAKENFDAVISFTDIPNVLTFLSIKSSGKNIAYIPSVHTNLLERNSRYQASFRLFLVRYLHKIACCSSGNVVAVSKGARDAVLELYKIPGNKVKTIYNPVLDDSDICLNRKTIEHHENKIIRLVAAGRLTKAKNYHLMIDAIKALNSGAVYKFHLDIYGEGELEQPLKEYVVDNKLQKHVSFKGFVSDLRERLPLYDIFLFSSDWEGFGNVLVEAISVGLPVISTDCPSGPCEILNYGEFGRLVKVGDVDGFANAVIEEVSSPLEVDISSLNQHLDKFRESVISQKYVDLVDFN
ncbi:glycosyltransferase [Halomonas mongoliensis]|uniref:glycosyltransferase n=1 Tax=Halomonas mongoliensis TaxID=321265 RepID=UPI00403AF710